MALRISTNVASINAQQSLRRTNIGMERSMARLSSGFRINQAADDAAGLAISENLRGQIRGMKQASRNSEDGVSLVQVAEGGLNEVSSILIRLRELGVQASSDTIGDVERKFLDVEYQQLKSEIQRISEVTEFNGRDLLNGTGGIFDIQVGTHNDPFKDRISFNASAANSSAPPALLNGYFAPTCDSAFCSGPGTTSQPLRLQPGDLCDSCAIQGYQREVSGLPKAILPPGLAYKRSCYLQTAQG